MKKLIFKGDSFEHFSPELSISFHDSLIKTSEEFKGIVMIKRENNESESDVVRYLQGIVLAEFHHDAIWESVANFKDFYYIYGIL